MRNIKPGRWLLLFIFVLSVISGFLMSKASLVGKAGMTLFYQEYNFLKQWWKGALLVFIVLTGLLILHGELQKRLRARKSRNFHFIAVIFSITGLYFTYNDFRHTISHHLLGERFHLGVYLFWLAWIVIALFYLVTRKDNVNAKSNQVDEF